MGNAQGSGRARAERRGAFGAIELLLALGIFAAIAAVTLPSVIAARKSHSEADAVHELKQVITAQAIFRKSDAEHDGNLDYGMLTELSNTTLVDGPLGSGQGFGYVFEATYSLSTSEFLWFAVANPAPPGRARAFAANQAGVIYFTNDGAYRLDNTTCGLPTDAPLPHSR